MSYQVLARQYRPKNFQEMVGQTHVLRALINALDNQRLHHAYLFTGTRGVGKTTIARILAKCLNCLQGVSSTPCGVCSVCQEIDQGRFVDLIEVDAASRTKVEDTRELLENVQYAPTSGRYKVYLIDEVHMLSGHSFNALLKTLEEPPEHVKFLLATTDPQKLPVTVLSRCLQFFLKKLPIEQIAEYLQQVLKQENIAFESQALFALAEAADGSMRDGLSLLDQAIAYSDSNITAAAIQEMLGAIDKHIVFNLLNALADNDLPQVFAVINKLAEQAPDFANVLESVLSILHRVALAQALPELIDNTMGDKESILALAAKLSVEDAQLFYQIGLHGRRDLPLAPSDKSGFEMTLLRMLSFRPAGAPSKVTKAARSSQAAKAAAPVVVKTNPQQAQWTTIIENIDLTGITAVLASHCVMTHCDENEVHLQLDKGQAPLLNPALKLRLEKALQDYFSKPIKLTINAGEQKQESPAAVEKHKNSEKEQQALQSLKSDPNVKEIIDVFNGTIDADSVKPI